MDLDVINKLNEILLHFKLVLNFNNFNLSIHSCSIIALSFIFIIYILISITSSKKVASISVNEEKFNKNSYIPKPIYDFQWDKVVPVKSYPFKNAPYKLTMGIKNLNLQEWLLIEPTYLNRIENKTKIINNSHADYPKDKDMRNSTLFVTPEVIPSIIEFYDIVMNYMYNKYPTCFNKDEHYYYNLITSKKYKIDETDPNKLQEYLVENIEEDFIILMKDETKVNEPNGQEYFFKGGVFAFAAGFNPRDRFNKPLSFIHHPVPNYETKLKFSMNKFFDRLKPGEFVTRSNFSIQTHSKFYVDDANKGHNLPKDFVQKPLDYDDLNFEKNQHYRSERQVLTKLPKTKAIVFTIRTYLLPLSQVKNDGKEVCERLVGAIDGFPEEVAQYKRSQEWGPALKKYLLS
ncbi:unnamed protein product [Candida verbasci]|uniref:Uncharacterized protein n=1 Tax=Candida verbasci TaxID=1227364 RepID=A0A9W4TZN7_9ASCO|nr:unnamed protein product [Candida verbasci]